MLGLQKAMPQVKSKQVSMPLLAFQYQETLEKPVFSVSKAKDRSKGRAKIVTTGPPRDM